MNYNDLHYRAGLGLLYGIGPKRAKDLLHKLGGIEPLFKQSINSLSKQTGYKPEFFKRMKRAAVLNETKEAVEFHLSKGIESIFYTDSRYPRRLNNCEDAPLNLYMKGNINLNDAHFVAIVGTRLATSYGRDICRSLIESFRGKNIVVVSGLALGIDTYVHHYCVEFGVPTIAVLGHGLDRIYPHQNRNLAKGILENGALITEFLPGTNPDKENFPRRNRIVAGMTDATIVIESKLTGGSLITADLAEGYNRDVFAFPGAITADSSQGCNALIAQQKAQLIQHPDEFLQFMGWDLQKEQKQNIQRQCLPNLSVEQQAIVELIRNSPDIHIDILADALGTPMSQLNVELFTLEMSGVVKGKPGKCYSLL